MVGEESGDDDDVDGIGVIIHVYKGRERDSKDGD